MKLNLFFSLEELDVVTPEATGNVSAGLSSMIKNLAVPAVLEMYAKYLLDNKLVENKEAAITIVSKIISVAMDRGDATVAVLDQVKAFIEQYIPVEVADENKCCMKKHLAKMMFCQFNLEDQGNLTDEEYADLKAFQEVQKQYQEAKARLMEKFGGEVTKIVSALIATYSPNFDKGFIEQF